MKGEMTLILVNTFTNYIGVRGLLAIVVTVSLCSMILWEKPIPNDFYIIVSLVLGYYFGRNERNGKHDSSKGDC